MIIAAALAVFAAIEDDGREAPPTSSGGATSETKAGAPVTAPTGDLPPAPWRAAAVARRAVPSAYVAAWDRARNRASCALLFPLDGGPEMAGATPTGGQTPEDRGWDIFLTGTAGSIEVLGLFDKTTETSRPPGDTPAFTRTWADGSKAVYRADVGDMPPGSFDASTSPFEALLTLPDQACAYRIYDTLGKEHLEATFERLRLMAK